jgi:hypothetical protein
MPGNQYIYVFIHIADRPEVCAIGNTANVDRPTLTHDRHHILVRVERRITHEITVAGRDLPLARKQKLLAAKGPSRSEPGHALKPPRFPSPQRCFAPDCREAHETLSAGVNPHFGDRCPLLNAMQYAHEIL